MEVVKRCKTCHIAAEKMTCCGQCREIYYCSKECQRTDWPEHRDGCNPANKDRMYYVKQIRKNKTYYEILNAMSLLILDGDIPKLHRKKERIICIDYVFLEPFPKASFYFWEIPKKAGNLSRSKLGYPEDTIFTHTNIYKGEQFVCKDMGAQSRKKDVSRNVVISLDEDTIPSEIIEKLKTQPLTANEPYVVRFEEKDFL